VTGTLAVLLRAKKDGVIPNVHDVIDALLGVNFHVSESLIENVLRQAGE
jgi:predicted nucleic acid-binding protein